MAAAGARQEPAINVTIICIYICYIYIYIYTYTRVFVCMYVSICIYANIFICLHFCVYTLQINVYTYLHYEATLLTIKLLTMKLR